VSEASDSLTMEMDMQIGYARTSSVEQEAGLEAQHRDLTSAGAEKLSDSTLQRLLPR
jgi:hypothetical protein